MRVAIIDDEKQWVSHTKKLVEKYYNSPNLEVKGYLSGIQFMQKLQPFDIVIMDLEMPGQDGFQTISEYKKIYKKSIILILTSHMELAQKGYVEKLLSSKGFFRTHRSYLVNLSMVRSYDKEDIIMVNNETAMVSARKYRVFKQKYLDWKFEHASF